MELVSLVMHFRCIRRVEGDQIWVDLSHKFEILTLTARHAKQLILLPAGTGL